MLTHENFDFWGTQALQVKEDIYAFERSPLQVIKYFNVTKMAIGSAPIKKELASMDHNRSAFAIARLDDATDIYVTGGWLTEGLTDTVMKYKIRADEWAEGPELRKSRGWHSTTATAEKIFVFGGQESNG